MRSFRFLGLVMFAASVLLWAASLTPAGNAKKDNKKKDKKDDVDIVGVVVNVDRDNNPKDKDIGSIQVRTLKNNVVKVVVLKTTDILRNGKKVDFKALDKGDAVSIFTKKNMPQTAEKIVIRKDG